MNQPAIHKLLRMKRLSLLALAGAAASAPAYGELSFETKVIEDVIPHDAKAYPFAFAFENKGEHAVEITEIKTSCGCTTAKLPKKTYAPGEKGTIKGSFSVGSRQGKQHKTVRVLTDDIAQPEIQLALRLEIPKLVSMKPGLLLWRVGSEPEAKTLTVEPNGDLGVKVLSVECESEDFAVEPVDQKNGESDYQVVVAPVTTESTGRGLIKVRIGLGEAEPKTVYAHALIR